MELGMWNICREVCFSACFSRGIRDDIEEEDDQVSSYAVFLSFTLTPQSLSWGQARACLD